MTPATAHYGKAVKLHEERARVLASAYSRTPERFVLGPPRPPALPTPICEPRPWTWLLRRSDHV